MPGVSALSIRSIRLRLPIEAIRWTANRYHPAGCPVEAISTVTLVQNSV